jgi:hypothetical protein
MSIKARAKKMLIRKKTTEIENIISEPLFYDLNLTTINYLLNILQELGSAKAAVLFFNFKS